jgi:hypothetical protein
MEVLFGHELFRYDVLPRKPLPRQLESYLPPKEWASIASNVAANALYVLEEEAIWKISVLVEV